MFFDVQRMIDGTFNPTLCLAEGDAPPADGGAAKGDEDPAAAGRLEALKAERAKRQALEERLAAIEAEREAERVKSAEEQGRFKELYTESNTTLTTVQEELSRFKAAEVARVEAQTAKAQAAVAALPENLRKLVPEGLSPDATLAQVENLKTLTGSDPTGTMGGGGKTPPKTPDASAEELQAAQDLMRGKPNMLEATALRIIRNRRARQKKS